MSVVKGPSVPIPNTDITSFLLDGILDRSSSPDLSPQFTEPFIYSAEDPESQRLSLVDFKYWVKCFASGLQSAGLEKGDRVMLVSPNYVHCMVIVLGTIAAGGIICTSQPDFKAREYTEQFRRDTPTWLFLAVEEPLVTEATEAWARISGEDSRRFLVDPVFPGTHKLENSWTLLLDEEH
jgi:acyl-CoA synthetase (AMP-forming)/AMP-acid ligase II